MSSKLFIRHVSTVSAYTLHQRRDMVQYVPPRELSGRKVATPLKPVQNFCSKELHKTPCGSVGDNTAAGNDKLKEARERYRARKQQIIKKG